MEPIRDCLYTHEEYKLPARLNYLFLCLFNRIFYAKELYKLIYS